jgi:hypothetical protein
MKWNSEGLNFKGLGHDEINDSIFELIPFSSIIQAYFGFYYQKFIHCLTSLSLSIVHFFLEGLSATSLFPMIVHPLSNFPNSSIISTTQGSWPPSSKGSSIAHFP